MPEEANEGYTEWVVVAARESEQYTIHNTRLSNTDIAAMHL